MEGDNNTCDDIEQTAPKLSHRRKASSKGDWIDRSTIAVAAGNVMGVFASKPLAAVLANMLLGTAALGYTHTKSPNLAVPCGRH